MSRDRMLLLANRHSHEPHLQKLWQHTNLPRVGSNLTCRLLALLRGEPPRAIMTRGGRTRRYLRSGEAR